MKGMSKEGFQVYKYKSKSFMHIHNKKYLGYNIGSEFGTNLPRECKNTLTNIIIENYFRSKSAQPIIPIIFIINHLKKDVFYDIDIKKIATSHKYQEVTNRELRRFYNIYTEMDDEIQTFTQSNNKTDDIKNIAEQSIKFVKIKVTTIENQNYYSLEETEPFWKDPAWDALWENRVKARKVKSPKAYSWRKDFATVVSKNSNTFFNDNSNNNNLNQNNDEEKQNSCKCTIV